MLNVLPDWEGCSTRPVCAVESVLNFSHENLDFEAIWMKTKKRDKLT